MINADFTWAFSAEKRAIPLFHSTERERPILFIGGVHGDEPEGVAMAEGLLQWLKSDTSQPRLPWALIPCLNPDGYLRARRTNGNGVDLNRNYPSRDWSPEARDPRYFPGLQPASESEIQAVVKFIDAYKPRMIIHFHSWVPCVVHAGDPALPVAKELARVSGYSVKDDIGYPTPGSLARYGWFDLGIPIICIEEQAGTPRARVWPRFAPAFTTLLERPHEVGLA